jgi:hypothetical protein
MAREATSTVLLSESWCSAGVFQKCCAASAGNQTDGPEPPASPVDVVAFIICDISSPDHVELQISVSAF